MSHMKIQLDSPLFRDLKYAAIDPHKRQYFIVRALNKYMLIAEAAGIALIRYSNDAEKPYTLTYCGRHAIQMEKWLLDRVTPAADSTIANLTKTSSIISHTKTQFVPYHNGLLIIWHTKKQNECEEHHEVFLDYLKAISHIEASERLYFYDMEQPFDSELSTLLKQKDKNSIMELLTLTKTITDCDFVFWGDANSKYVEIEAHLGSRDNGFGFQLPVGQGIGGNAAQNNRLLQVSDYQNCEYRYQEVSTTVDEENVRSVLALPFKDEEANTSGVLYASNRKIKPFPLQTKLLLLRLGQSIEPLEKQRELKQFFTKSHYKNFIKERKEELRNIVRHAKQISELEVWLEDIMKGVVTIVNQHGHPYSSRTTKELHTKKQQPFVYPLALGNQKQGKLLIWTNMKLPPRDWPDLIEDVISAIYIIWEREIRIHHVIERERSEWITSLMNQATDLTVQYKKGIQLGIPIDSGEVWAIYWGMNDRQFTSSEKIKIEEIVLNWTKSPFIYSERVGFILFDKPRPCQPEKLRNQLLKEFPIPTWIIHSATYSSFKGLQNTLRQLQLLLRRITTFKQKKYVLEFSDFGLESLLTNPNLSDNLNKFANKVLCSIIKYDQENNTQFTKTLALYLVYQSAKKVSKQLYIHTNTVHYRVNRAKELLEMDLSKHGNDIALRLASYIWLYNLTDLLE